MIPWHTPFSTSSFPAVQVVPSNEATGAVDVLVHPNRVGSLPVYLVKFPLVVAYRSHHEGMMPSNWIYPPSDLYGHSAFILENSPWQREFQGVAGYIEASFARPFTELKHFVIIGGDNCVEVLSYEPEIERIDGTRIVREYSV